MKNSSMGGRQANYPAKHLEKEKKKIEKKCLFW
jgi:hypothetical protein